jgi:hypothetical protein
MNYQFLDKKEDLIEIFSQELSNIINGGYIFEFLDVSGFNPKTFSGISKVNPIQQHDPLIIPIICINGLNTPIPIVVNPKHFSNFISFLRYIVAGSCYYIYTEDIYNSVNSKIFS